MDVSLAKQFGRVVRNFRAECGLTQQQLAFECDLDRTYISLLERGRRQPSLTTIFRIADAVGKNPEALVAAVRV